MKEILSSLSDGITGSWQYQDDSGYQPATNGGSQLGGNNENHDLQSFLAQSVRYESGSGASGFWYTRNTYINSGGYHNNGTGSRTNLRSPSDNH